MEKKVEILAYHGWGINASFWKNLDAVIPNSITLKPANRGYFGKPFYPRFDADTKVRVVFTHSYGLQWCNTAVLSKADVLVIFNGFGDFHPEDKKLNSISKNEDLKQLRNTRFPLIDLDFGSTMVAVDGAKDKILLSPRGESITKAHYNKKFVKIFEDEGHALPFLNPQKCWSYLCSIIPIFERNENNR